MLTVLIMNDTETFLASFELMDAVHEYLTSWILLQFTSPKAVFFPRFCALQTQQVL